MTSETTKDDTAEITKSSKTERFAQWLMTRAEKKEEKETSLESLMKFNIFLSITTVVGLFGSVALDYILMAYLWI